MYNPNIRDHAALIGFTRFVHIVMASGDELQVYIDPETDLDSRFRAICALEGDMLKVSGWLACDITDIIQIEAMAA